MKIINPPTCVTDFGPVQFEQRDSDLDDVFAVTVAGDRVAELAPLTLPGGGVLVIDHCTEAAVEPTGCWSLSIADSSGRNAETHVLLVASDIGTREQELTGELAVWATLAVLWASGDTAVGRG